MRFYGKNVSLCVSNKQYTIEKPYKSATRNEKKNSFFKICWFLGLFFEKAVVLENGQIWNQSIFLNETSSLMFTENEGLADKHGHQLMPAMLIFQKHGFFEKGSKSQQFL